MAISTVHVLAGLARVALAAGDDRVQHDFVADVKAGDVGSHRVDHARAI